MGKSSSSEDYLKCIMVLQKKNDSVRSIDIAEEMGVTKPSVCNAMKKIRKQKWIYFDEGRQPEHSLPVTALWQTTHRVNMHLMNAGVWAQH